MTTVMLVAALLVLLIAFHIAFYMLRVETVRGRAAGAHNFKVVFAWQLGGAADGTYNVPGRGTIYFIEKVRRSLKWIVWTERDGWYRDDPRFERSQRARPWNLVAVRLTGH